MHKNTEAKGLQKLADYKWEHSRNLNLDLLLKKDNDRCTILWKTEWFKKARFWSDPNDLKQKLAHIY